MATLLLRIEELEEKMSTCTNKEKYFSLYSEKQQLESRITA